MEIKRLKITNSTGQFELDNTSIGDTLDLKVIKCARRTITPVDSHSVQGVELLVYVPVFECYAAWWLTLSAYRFSKLDVTYDVFENDVKIGTYKTTEPASWDKDNGEFHKNFSSWCADNAMDDPGYEGKKLIAPEDECLCGVLEFRCTYRSLTVKRT